MSRSISRVLGCNRNLKQVQRKRSGEVVCARRLRDESVNSGVNDLLRRVESREKAIEALSRLRHQLERGQRPWVVP